ncbi:MAG: adenine-specific methyltransferase EcoRI family protein, partial [Patescibacteria group bacterium]|nr:adenine-specific methyltransferase EcoRI family protein [Patescibacteria group bacterium]
HQKLRLMTIADNKKYNKQISKNENSYKKYDNYDAIEVPYTNAIPTDYSGIMGVPKSFLNKYNPAQFEILGQLRNHSLPEGFPRNGDAKLNGKDLFSRLAIKHKKK